MKLGVVALSCYSSWWSFQLALKFVKNVYVLLVLIWYSYCFWMCSRKNAITAFLPLFSLTFSHCLFKSHSIIISIFHTHTPICSQAQLVPEYWGLEHVLLHLLDCFFPAVLLRCQEEHLYSPAGSHLHHTRGVPRTQFLYWPWGRVWDAHFHLHSPTDQLNDMATKWQLHNEK